MQALEIVGIYIIIIRFHQFRILGLGKSINNPHVGGGGKRKMDGCRSKRIIVFIIDRIIRRTSVCFIIIRIS